jgi:hypothetical protein
MMFRLPRQHVIIAAMIRRPQFRLSTLLWLTLALIAGCSDVRQPRTPSTVVSAWGTLGIFLPPDEDVAFIQNNLPASLAALRSGLSHENQHIRMSSAYVAGKLGSRAEPLVGAIMERLQAEPESIVRVYLATSLASIGAVDSNCIRGLNTCFRAEENDQTKTAIAGAIVRLASPAQEPDAWQWLLDSLRAFPPDPPAESDPQHAFWERRWTAVEHLRGVRGKDEILLPPLRALMQNQDTPQWVIDQQVNKAIAEIESRISPDD